uniref:26S proteasome non-ATPase regulatory subunit 6 n=1 Tax=Isotomurus palustris TaxID=36144 RepID=A0A481SYY1_9HEXA|nr:26S proteasome non-ATPase regulatory subunit [Isotomurus palustris]
MPIEASEDTIEKNPDLGLAQMKFLVEQPDLDKKRRGELSKAIIAKIRKDHMAPFYEVLLKDVNNTLLGNDRLSPKELEEMKAQNTAKILEFDAFIEDAEKNLTEMEVRENNLKKSEYLCRIGDKDAAIAAFRKTYEKTVSLGQRLDIVFHQIRIGLFYMDHDLISRNIDKAKTLIDEGGDWDRRNRLKVYQGAYSMSIRDFKTAAAQFLDTISTFTSNELMDYSDFVKYTVLMGLISLPRNELVDKIIKGAEIQENLHQQPEVKAFLMTLYECKYAEFFQNLAKIEIQMKEDRLLTPHYRHYVREMRIKAYCQLLESYSSLTLKYMADSFGVTEDFIDKELHRFIAAGRLHCKIDKVAGVVETTRPDNKNWQYQATIKQGDILLNRIQKLSRVINI